MKHFVAQGVLIASFCLLSGPACAVPPGKDVATAQLIPWLAATGKYGFVDKAGSLRIPARYDDVHAFYYGRATAKEGKYWGYLNQHGTWIVKPRYTSARNFNKDGTATALIHADAVKLGSGFMAMTLVHQHYHYEKIDRSGKVLQTFDTDNGPAGIPDKPLDIPDAVVAALHDNNYLFAGKYGDLYALASKGCSTGNKPCGLYLYDVAGHRASSQAYRYLSRRGYQEGFLPVLCSGSYKHGYVNRRGKQVIGCVYDATFPFNDGLAIVATRGKGYGVIDRHGRIVIGLSYDDLRYPKDGYLVAQKGKLWGIINARTGKAVVALTHESMHDVSIIDVSGSPFFASKESDGWQVVTRRGKRIGAGFDAVWQAGDGRIAVSKRDASGEHWGAIDAGGKLVIPARYDDILTFHDGLARVQRAGHALYIDAGGKEYAAPGALPAG